MMPVLGLDNAMAVLRRRYRLMVGVFLLVVAVVLTVFATLTPYYSATALVSIDPTMQRTSDLGNVVTDTQPDSALVDTELGVIRSREVALRVIKKLDLDQDPEFAESASQSSPAQRIEQVVDNVTDDLGVGREALSYIVGITFQSTNAAKAPRIANAFAQEYLAVSRQRRGVAAGSQAEALDRQLVALRKQLAEADARITAYRAKTGTIGGGADSGTIEDQLALGIADELAQAEGEAASMRSRATSARTTANRASGAAVSEVLASPAITELRKQRGEILQRSSQITMRYGPSHPEAVEVNEQLQAIDQELSAETARILTGLDGDARASVDRVARLRGQLASSQAQQASRARALVTVDTMQRDADAMRATYNDLSQAAQMARQQAQVSGAQAALVSSAVTPIEPAFPKRSLFIAFAMVLGAAAAVAAGLIAETSRSGIYTANELHDQLAIPVFATLPELSRKKLQQTGGAGLPADYILAQPASRYANSLRDVRTGLTDGGSNNARIVAITSATPGEGKSAIAFALARVMAQAGDRVLLIDGDIRKSALGRSLPQKPALGILEVLEDPDRLNEALITDAVPSLDLLPLVEVSFTPKDTFGDGRMATLLDGLRHRYQWILIDAPPALSAADARTLAQLADRCLLVVRWLKTPVDVLKSAVEKLGADNLRSAGAILNRVAASRLSMRSIDAAYYADDGAYFQN